MSPSGKRQGCALVWFREDLRLADNPALQAAIDSGRPVTAFYVFDEETDGPRRLGGASRWWLGRSLQALSDDCEKLGLPFAIVSGATEKAVKAAVKDAGAEMVVWNRRYVAAEQAIDSRLKEQLRADGIEVESFNARLLHEPWEIRSKAGQPLKVYSPYWRSAVARGEPRDPLPRPKKSDIAAGPKLKGESVASLKLEPTKPDWAGGLREAWTPGEAGAADALKVFVEERLKGYAVGRDRPDREATSRMSPHLRFGEISPFQLWQAVEGVRKSGGDVDKFQSELGWREFSYHLLNYNPDLAEKNFQPRFDSFPWPKPKAAEIAAWQQGKTGYPLVDAGMRQLWTTGWMHNRVRMVCASFLIKHLLVDWRTGEDWFWDTLVDADPANNAASWQWVAGSGADAAPFFRVFNPTLQGEKFDPEGAYVAAFVPELKDLPKKWIHRPAEAPADVLKKAGVTLGETYPKPIVDHQMARDRALSAFDKTKAHAA